MGSKNDMTRKDFLTLTFTLIGTSAIAATCSDNNNNVPDGSVTGRGGTTGAGGTSHATGQGGATGGTTGTAGGGGNGASSCTDPLPEVQAPADHTHTLVIHASVLSATTAQMIDTGAVLGHMHVVTLQPADLATLKGGGSVMITTSSAGTPAHTHVFTISCT